ncbi:MAG: hypothetical protein ACK4K3_12580 [Aquabacterium sp.]
MNASAPMTTLRYLVFDLSEGTDEVHTLDALASVTADQRDALAQEAEMVRAWCRTRFPQGPGPLENGHPWDEDLQWQVEGAWHTLSWSLSGDAAFAQAFEAAWVPRD